MKTYFKTKIRSLYRHSIQKRAIVPRLILFGLIGIIFALGLSIAVKPATAQSLIDHMVELLSQKVGFSFSDDQSNFSFMKETPNYIAYAGDGLTAGGHKLKLVRGDAAISYWYESSSIAESRNFDAQQIPSMLPSEQLVLDQAEALLLDATDESSHSSRILSETFSSSDRRILENAREILQYRISTESAQHSQEHQDFLLLVAIKSQKIRALQQSVDTKMTDIEKQVSRVVSKAQLLETNVDRRVLFSDIAPGIDFQYRLTKGGLQQRITLKSAQNARNVFTFRMDVANLTYRNIGQGVWYFSDSAGKDVMRTTIGHARDEQRTFTNDIHTKISQDDAGHLLTIYVPHDWLIAPDRVYPVTIISAIEVVPELRQGQPGYDIQS